MAKEYILLDTYSIDGFYLTQGYGINADYYKKYNLLFHEGIDHGHKNKKIIFRSPLPQAKVIQDFDTNSGNYGNHLVLWDWVQQIALWINHLDNNLLSIGQVIYAGDPVGEMGATGNANGEHTHTNFVITDAAGNRLYNTKPQNWGYLDPQHPQDPNPPVLLPGVPEYKVIWKTKMPTQPIPSPTPPDGGSSDDCQKNLAKSRQETKDARRDRGLINIEIGLTHSIDEDPGVEKSLEAIKNLKNELAETKSKLADSNRVCQSQLKLLKTDTESFFGQILPDKDHPIASYEDVLDLIGFLRSRDYSKIDNMTLFLQILSNYGINIPQTTSKGGDKNGKTN